MLEISTDIIDAIKENKCILFLGPLMSAFNDENDNNKDVSHTQLYCNRLQHELNRESIVFDEKAKSNPFYLNSRYLNNGNGTADLDKSITENVYSRTSELYYELALIPFNTIINFGFDYLMKDALEARGYEFEFKYYNYKGPERKYLGIDNNIQLCFNIYGAKHRPESRVYTEDDQIKFLRSINSGPELPDDLLSRIKQIENEKKSYIFLGFDFEDWTFRFLLDILEIPKTNLAYTTQLEGSNIALMTNDFYKHRFGLEFLHVPLKDFIQKLIKAYKPTKHEFGYLSYHEDDVAFRNNISAFINASKLVLTRGIKFWDKSRIEASEVLAEVSKEHRDKATIYIPLISIRFLNHAGLKEELNEMLARQDVLIFPIILSNCPWNISTDLEKRAKIILPGKNTVLKTSEKTPGDDDYQKIVNLINSKIR